MSLSIARMYRSQDEADAVAKELRQNGFNPEVIHAGAQPAAMAPASEGQAGDPVRDAIRQAGVARKPAEIFAEHVRRGEALVILEPLFGAGRAATSILDSHDPVEIDLPEEVFETVRPDPAAPLSSWFGWRVLLNDPTPLSNYLKQPVLKSEPASSATLDRIRRESEDPAPLSAKIKMPLLSDNPAPLSSKAGWRLLLEKAAPLSERAGWRVLLDTAAPLSKRMGRRVLLDDPAPLSNKFGWRLLSDNPAPLSSWLGLRTLSKE